MTFSIAVFSHEQTAFENKVRGGRGMSDDGWLESIQSVHIIGAGLRKDRPAHQAFHDAGDLGYRMIPVHPNDAGHTILGRPIRSHPWLNSRPELFVLFLSPDRVIASLRQWLLEDRTIPFISNF